MKKICVVTSSRADYGLLKWVIKGLKQSKKIELSLIVTGSHLSKKHGLTYKEIIKDEIKIDKKLNLDLTNDTDFSITRAMGNLMIKLSNSYRQIKPDLLLILGDRYEIFSAASCAMMFKIPIVHIHGGEITEGSIDDAIRHSITKMSHIHFVASEVYKKRIIQLGESKEKVYNVGGLGIDALKKIKFLSKSQIEKKLNFKLKNKNILITYHPVTLEKNSSKDHINEIFKALNEFPEIGIIFTFPNADQDSKVLFSEIKKYSRTRKNVRVYGSMGQNLYFSTLKKVDGVLGNSSSGIIEVPFFKKGTINIGNRQTGRLKASSIIDCEPKYNEIKKALDTLFSNQFQKELKNIKNLYGNGGASNKIVKILEDLPLEKLLFKKFNDIK
jgi:GDP/UDP-N,N'-diacetylbacillosamine 2-epimerase (hydrolysing)